MQIEIDYAFLVLWFALGQFLTLALLVTSILKNDALEKGQKFDPRATSNAKIFIMPVLATVFWAGGGLAFYSIVSTMIGEF